MRTKLQTRILINLYNPRNPAVEIERRKIGVPTPDKVGTWYSTRTYHPGEASKKRLNAVVNHWVSKQWANINLNMPLIEIEPTA